MVPDALQDLSLLKEILSTADRTEQSDRLAWKPSCFDQAQGGCVSVKTVMARSRSSNDHSWKRFPVPASSEDLIGPQNQGYAQQWSVNMVSPVKTRFADSVRDGVILWLDPKFRW